MALNGPSINLYNIIDCLERVQTFSWEVLPISSEGPNNTPERDRRPPRMGPIFSWEMLPIASDGPTNIPGEFCRWH